VSSSSSARPLDSAFHELRQSEATFAGGVGRPLALIEGRLHLQESTCSNLQKPGTVPTGALRT
jgi:hypothetical protein